MSQRHARQRRWMALKEHGIRKFGRLIDQNIHQARYLTGQIESHPKFELMAPTRIDIVCFRYNTGCMEDDVLTAVNLENMLRLQESGTAAVSDTLVHNRHCLRVAIANHRTRIEDLDLLIAESVRLGDAIVGERVAQS